MRRLARAHTKEAGGGIEAAQAHGRLKHTRSRTQRRQRIQSRRKQRREGRGRTKQVTSSRETEEQRARDKVPRTASCPEVLLCGHMCIRTDKHNEILFPKVL